jgi:peptide/nickel transport system substrate-binding protein
MRGRHQIMKKKFNRIFAVVLTLGLFLTGCSGQTASSSQVATSQTVATGTPADGGNIVIAESDDPQNINPLFVVDQTSFDIQQALYAPFFEIVKGKLFYGNGLLESVTPNSDSSTFTLKLKSNLKWHDGQPITADDIVFTMNTLIDKNQNVPYQSYGYIDGKAVVTKKVDNLTVVITLPKSSAGFLGGLSQIYCIPKHIYQNVSNIGKSTLNNNPVGSGPYKFKSYTPGQSFVVQRFNDYFDGKPHLETITFKIVKNASTADASLASGDINARLINSTEYNMVNKSGKVNIYSYDSGRVNALSFNQSKSILKDVRVRQAIAYALNKEELTKFAFVSNQFATPAYSIFTPDTIYYNGNLTKYDNDVTKAKQLLQRAGKSSLKLNILYISTDKTMESEATYIKSQLTQVGIDLELYPLDESTYKSKIKDKNTTDYDLLLNFYTLGEEPSLYADIMSGDSRSNYSHVKNSALDTLWEKGNSTSDNTTRGKIYDEIQKRVNDNMDVYPIAYSKAFYAFDKSYGGYDKAILKTIYYDYSKLYAIQK